jgi:hypothetical protein
MKSRYDYFKDGATLDIDGQTFPDPLFNYNEGVLTQLPTEYKITSRDLARFWTCMFEQYGMNEMDDVWLNINGVKYVMDLRPGDIIYKVVQNDLDGFMTTKQIGVEE